MSGENPTPPVDAADARRRRDDELLQELAVLRRDVNAVRIAIGRIDQSVVGEFSVRWPLNSLGIGPPGV